MPKEEELKEELKELHAFLEQTEEVKELKAYLEQKALCEELVEAKEYVDVLRDISMTLNKFVAEAYEEHGMKLRAAMVFLEGKETGNAHVVTGAATASGSYEDQVRLLRTLANAISDRNDVMLTKVLLDASVSERDG